MIDVKSNFKGQYLDNRCNFCNSEETQRHIMECSIILNSCSETSNNKETKYEDIFKSPTEQIKVTKFYQKLLRVRDDLLRN